MHMNEREVTDWVGCAGTPLLFLSGSESAASGGWSPESLFPLPLCGALAPGLPDRREGLEGTQQGS